MFMEYNPLPRLDTDVEHLRNTLLSYCRLKPGEIWHDPTGQHIVACGDSCSSNFIKKVFSDNTAKLAVHDPPYNLVMFEKQTVDEFINWCRLWIENSYSILDNDSALYIWLGADQNDNFQPLPQFMMMMSDTEFLSRSFISMRNQRGYGTQKNWMAVRQELLYYTKGYPEFEVQYTDIPKILRGYYKEVNGQVTENTERGKSPTIRPGNIWVDVQQVFYRMEENVNGCYGQKPLKSIERIIEASSKKGEIVTDFFAHSGTTLIACEKTNRSCVTIEIDPIFAEITIRRLEHYRNSGKTGWQSSNPFATELRKLNKRQLEKIGITV
jgi:site-specific DNA-methyltransferase (adenine-specific)